MITCPRCGARNPEDAEECEVCQMSLTDAPTAAEDETESDQPVQFPVVASGWSREIMRQATNLLMAGKSREVPHLCHEVIEREPRNLAAYELLAMAEEENGNLHLALQAYEQVVDIDPESRTDREKIAALREQIAEEQPETEEEENARHLKSLNRWATVALVGSLVVLVAVIVSLFMVKAHRARGAQEMREAAFAAKVTQGEQLLEAGRYAPAMLALREAERIKPGDSRVRELWSNAYQQHRIALDNDYRSLGGKLSLEPRQNPFAPTCIGPRKDSSPVLQTARGGWSGGIPLPPDTRIAEWPAPLSEGQKGPLEDLWGYDASGGGAEAAENPNILEPQPGTGGRAIPQQPAGEIRIWVDEPAETIPSGDKLRDQADRLRRQGNGEEAIAKYRAAQERYREEIQQDPSTRNFSQAAIDSMEKSIKVCQEHSED